MTKRTLDLICLGEPLYELNQEPDGRYLGGLVGDTANCAVAAARCGLRSGMLTHLGDDQFGASFLRLWLQENVNSKWVQTVEGAETGLYFVTHDDDGHHFSYRRRQSAAARMTPGDVPMDAIASAHTLHVSGISMAISNSAADAVFAAVELARAHDTRVSFDTNLRLALAPLDRSRALFLDLARRSDLLLPGFDDACQLTGLTDPDEILDHLLDTGCPLIAMTMGADGVRIATPDERFTLPAAPVHAIDATGAGDTFDGAFLSRWIQNDDLRSAANFANAAAALSTTRRGAIQSMPQRTEVEQFLASQQS